MARRRTRYLLLAVAMMLAGGAIPAIAVGVEDPTNAFSDEFDGTTDLGLYLLDRFNPGLGYTPTLTEGTYDGRAVGIFHIDSTSAKRVRIRQVTDGTSNTLMVMEVWRQKGFQRNGGGPVNETGNRCRRWHQQVAGGLEAQRRRDASVTRRRVPWAACPPLSS